MSPADEGARLDRLLPDLPRLSLEGEVGAKFARFVAALPDDQLQQLDEIWAGVALLLTEVIKVAAQQPHPGESRNPEPL